MTQHLLVSLSTRKPYKEAPQMPKGSTYDNTLGMWLYNNSPLIEDSQFETQSTKKCDMETGEDQKGE